MTDKRTLLHEETYTSPRMTAVIINVVTTSYCGFNTGLQFARHDWPLLIIALASLAICSGCLASSLLHTSWRKLEVYDITSTNTQQDQESAHQ